MAPGRRNIGFVIAVLVLGIAVASSHSWGQVKKKPGADNSPLKKRAVPARTRPVRTPVDVSDRKACFYELADLASFGLRFNDFFDYRANAVGEVAGSFPLDPIEQLDRTVRFDQLLKSNDHGFRAIVEEVRRISLDYWRVNRAYREYGAAGKGDLDQKAALARGFNTLGKIVAADAARDAATSRKPSGRTSFDENRFHDLLSKYEAGAQRRLDRASSELERFKETGLMMASLRCLLQDQLAQLWREKLLPELRKDSGPVTEIPIVEIGQPETLASIPRPLRERKRVPATAFLIRNTSGKTLHHLALEVKLRNDFGDEKSW
jgi:hypothetical protein